MPKYESIPFEKDIMVAVPHTGTVRTELAVRLIQYSPFAEILTSYSVPHDSNRNLIVKRFLKTNKKWLIMIDSDVVPPKNLLSILNTDKKIIGCPAYGLKLNSPVLAAFTKKKHKYVSYNGKKKGEVEVDAVGTACISIHRSVFEKLKPPYFRFGYDENGVMNNGEDFYFCELAKKNGFKIYINWNFEVMHIVDYII